MSPQEIPVHDITHLIFSFGFISPGDFQITNMADVKPSLFKEVAQLKDKNPNLSIMIALGGWTHNDPGKYQQVFSDMVSSAANRQKFIKNLLGFLSQYGYDGVDFDWEYPGADDRGGKDSDGKNYTQFLKELQAAIKGSGKSDIVTYTALTSYWYLRHFDLKAMNQYVDWINLMSYDLHGIWDRDNPIGNQILGHTNITEIDLALDLVSDSSTVTCLTKTPPRAISPRQLLGRLCLLLFAVLAQRYLPQGHCSRHWILRKIVQARELVLLETRVSV